MAYEVGDPIVYRKAKRSDSPGPRAMDIQPEGKGEEYTYLVNKYWLVQEVSEDHLIARTRRGKRIEVRLDDPYLKPASLWDRLFKSHLFPDA